MRALANIKQNHQVDLRAKIRGLEHELILERKARAALLKELEEERKKRLTAEEKIESLERRMKALEDEIRGIRASRRKTEDFLQDKIRKLEKAVADRDAKIEDQEKQLVWFRTQKFGETSEQHILESLEAATCAPGDEETNAEEIPEQKRPRGQQRGSKGHGRSKATTKYNEERDLEIPNCCCPDCGKQYKKLAQTADSPLTEMELMVFTILFHRRKYVSQCSCRGSVILTAPPPTKIVPRSKIGNSVWVHIVVRKFLSGEPTNRTLKELSLAGFSAPVGTVTGGLKIVNNLLAPLYEEIVNHCRGADLWNADETTWRMFGEGKSRWWLWILASSDAVVYVLDQSRSKSVPTQLLAGSKGLLVTDRYAAYKSLHADIIKAWCWVHVRRDFISVFRATKKLKEWAENWIKDITTLFVLNHRRFENWKNSRGWRSEQAELEKQAAYLHQKWEEELRQPNLHKQQKTILNSLKRHWSGLILFLSDPRIPMHNNRAERLLRNCVILRKNSYGSGAQWSGELAARVFSIFQTWLINGLDPQALLLEYFNSCSRSKPPPDLSEFLPWKMSESRKEHFGLPEKYQRPG